MRTTCQPGIIESGTARTKVDEARGHHLLVAMKLFDLCGTEGQRHATSKVTRMKRYERLDRGNVGKAG